MVSKATLPWTFRQVTGPSKKLPHTTWPAGLSPAGPLRASIVNGPPQKPELPLPVTESSVGACAPAPGTTTNPSTAIARITNTNLLIGHPFQPGAAPYVTRGLHPPKPKVKRPSHMEVLRSKVKHEPQRKGRGGAPFETTRHRGCRAPNGLRRIAQEHRCLHWSRTDRAAGRIGSATGCRRLRLRVGGRLMRLLRQPHGFERFLWLIEPLKAHGLPVPDGPYRAVTALDRNPACAPVAPHCRDHGDAVAGLDAPIDLDPEIADGVVELLGDRGKGLDPRVGSRFQRVARVDPLDIGVQQVRLSGRGSGDPTRVDAADDLHVLLRHRRPVSPGGGMPALGL